MVGLKVLFLGGVPYVQDVTATSQCDRVCASHGMVMGSVCVCVSPCWGRGVTDVAEVWYRWLSAYLPVIWFQ